MLTYLLILDEDTAFPIIFFQEQGSLSSQLGFSIPLVDSLNPFPSEIDSTFNRDTTGSYIDINGDPQTAAVDEPRFEIDGILIGAIDGPTDADELSYDVADELIQGTGALICDFNCLGTDLVTDRRVLELSDGTALNTISIVIQNTTDKIGVIIVSGGVQQVSEFSADSIYFNLINRVLINYEDDNINIYFNGGLIASTTTGNIPMGLSTIGVGCDYGDIKQLNGNIKDLRYYDSFLNAAYSGYVTQSKYLQDADFDFITDENGVAIYN